MNAVNSELSHSFSPSTLYIIFPLSSIKNVVGIAETSQSVNSIFSSRRTVKSIGDLLLINLETTSFVCPTFIATNLKLSLSLKVLFKLFSDGNSLTQGLHQVAQKFSKIYDPFRSSH